MDITRDFASQVVENTSMLYERWAMNVYKPISNYIMWFIKVKLKLLISFTLTKIEH